MNIIHPILNMKKIHITALIIFLGSYSTSYAQTGIESVLASIEKKNKALLAGRQYWDFRKTEYKTGLTLPNPAIQIQYLPGTPKDAGNQTDIFAVQSFDFPTAYRLRNELAGLQGETTVPQLAAQRQEVLYDGKVTCLEIIYRNRLFSYTTQRKTTLEKLLQDFQRRLDSGDGNVLDVNKVKLQLLEINRLHAENVMKIQRLQTHLNELNGGEPIVFRDTVYPLTPVTVNFEELAEQYSRTSPELQILESQRRVAGKKLEVSKTWQLPRFEMGYHFQQILGQRFNGIHAGVTLPLWEQKYRVEAARAEVASSALQSDASNVEFLHELREKYDLQDALKKSLEEYRAGLVSVNDPVLLDKALNLGEISTIEYFMESSFYHGAWLHYLETEYDYQVALASFFRYNL